MPFSVKTRHVGFFSNRHRLPDDCSICAEKFNRRDVIAITNCTEDNSRATKHAFHASCLKELEEHNPSNFLCPNDRRPLDPSHSWNQRNRTSTSFFRSISQLFSCCIPKNAQRRTRNQLRTQDDSSTPEIPQEAPITTRASSAPPSVLILHITITNGENSREVALPVVLPLNTQA